MKKFKVTLEWAGGTFVEEVSTDQGWSWALIYAMTKAVRSLGAKGFYRSNVEEVL